MLNYFYSVVTALGGAWLYDSLRLIAGRPLAML
jgi:hypothetical protein